eukprot:COSAG02_NODE_56106_length_287_cov_0.803191_1_plen_28_part_01
MMTSRNSCSFVQEVRVIVGNEKSSAGAR